MLEKTAASLEPCGFQRVLPCAAKSFRTTRQLHTAFWQHGAADLELSSTWQALMHGTFEFPGDSASSPTRSYTHVLSASTFLFDFLYPSGALALLRRISLSQADSLQYRSPFASPSPRFYALSLPSSRRQHSSSKSGSNPPVESEPDEGQSSIPEDHDASPHSPDAEEGGPAAVADVNGQPSHQDPDMQDMQEYDFETDDPYGGNHLEAINDLLAKDNPAEADRVWYHYRALDEESQSMYLAQILLFLSRAGRLSDCWKISDLFQRLGPTNWDGHTFLAGLKAEVQLQNNAQAIQAFVSQLKNDKMELPFLVDALDLLLAAALRYPTIDFLRDIWRHYPDMAARWDFDGIASQLQQVALVPGLTEKTLRFQDLQAELSQDASGPGFSPDGLNTLRKILVRRALASCADSAVVPLLNSTKDPMAFEDVLRFAVNKGRRRIATETYQVYRQLPGRPPSHAALHEAFRAYRTMDAPTWEKLAGIEQIWGDWYRFHTAPTRRAFQRHLGFHAKRGDKERVYKLWTEFVERFRDDPEHPVLEGRDTFAHLIQVHAVVGEADEAQRIFDDMRDKFGLKPSALYWNILLNAYVKAGDYDGAISTFDQLSTVHAPDQYSYATLMQMAGNRGDLGFTVELYRRARKQRVLANGPMLSSLIDAYCQNDYFREAEDVCVRAAQKGVVDTQMWNRLLHYNALRRDLAKINDLLSVMSEMGIPYDHFTYEQLLLGLALCKQSQHALRLLSVALKDHIFRVTPGHFQIVMGALLRTGEPGPVRRLHRLMEEYGLQSSFGTLFRLSQALAEYNSLPPHERARMKAKQWLGQALRSFYKLYGADTAMSLNVDPTQRPKKAPLRQLLPVGPEHNHFGTMVYIFTQLKDFIRSKELIQLYRYIYHEDRDPDILLPVSMLNSVMLADFQDQQYDRVRETWRSLFETAQREGRAPGLNDEFIREPAISPQYRYVLAGGLRIMQEVLFRQEDAEGIRRLIHEVQDAGFRVDSRNWNYHVQAIVQLKRYKEAFDVCEKILMPNWTGWAVARARENVKNQLPLDLRRKGSSPRYLRPTSTTLYYLARGYMELDRMSPWSAEAAQMIRDIDEQSFKTVRAIKSMIRVHSDLEYEIFGADDSPDFLDSEELSKAPGEEYAGDK
ncbi:hypothetical protein F4780DRAFT_589540 [Xylariomycetidae sp. FL0641]|nr:hypothetical protein F4780DRAFT_589540 [Xylariomycetidae sp. FL0641]